jgi:signal transduction histidine kinase
VLAYSYYTAEFVQQYRDELFPVLPIVFFSPPDRPLPGTVVTTAGDWSGSLEFALGLHPRTKQVFVISGDSDYDRYYSDFVRTLFQRFEKRVTLTYVTGRPLPELEQMVSKLPPDSVIYFVLMTQDGAGRRFEEWTGLEKIALAANAPIYVGLDTMLGHGVVGGRVWTTERVVRPMVAVSVRLLIGEPPEGIPTTVVDPYSYQLDWRQLRRWRIPEDSLPAGSVVLFREISIWERYRATIAVTAGVLLLQSLLIAGLVFERRRRRRAEIDSRRNLAAMAHLDRRAAMGELATSLAHELNQPLNAILQNAGVAQMLLTSHSVPSGLSEIADIISDIRKDDMRASEVIRRMRGLLQKRELESQPVDLNEVAQETVAIVRPDARSREIQLEMELADDVRPILGDRVHLQQVLLNLLMNAIDAVTTMPTDRRRVRVSITQSDGDVRLAVADGGIGISADRLSEIFEPFYTTKSGGSGMGMGLSIARSIVEAHAGRIAAENNAGGGATVWFSVPMAPVRQ